MATIPRSPSYLLQRQNTFYFRVGIPLGLRDRMGRRELRISLETGYLKAARIKAQWLSTAASAFFCQAHGDPNMAQLTSAQLNALFSKWLKQALAQWEHDHAVGRAKTPKEIANSLTEIQAELTQLKTSHTMGSYLGYQDEVIGITASQGKEISGDYDDVKHCCHAYVHARRSFLSILSKRLEGDYDYEVEELERFKKRQLLLMIEDEPQPVTVLQPKPKAKHKLSAVIDEYIDEKRRSGSWKERSLKELPPTLRLILEAIGDPDIEDIGAETLRGFKVILGKLPANRDKLAQTKGKPLHEIIELPDLKTVSIRRQNFILDLVSGLFEYAVNNGYIQRNLARGMQIKVKGRADEEREAFTDEDLRTIFSHPLFSQREAKRPWQLYLPLLGYYTGARLEELAQLALDDVVELEGIIAIDINENGDKKLKNIASRRVVPLHCDLIKRWGLLEYINEMRGNGATRLFPELKQIQGKYGHSPSQWFSRLRDKLGITGKKSFHSFRHTFANKLKQADVSSQAIKELMGHAKDDVTMDRYGKPLSPEVLKKAVMMIPLPPVPGV